MRISVKPTSNGKVLVQIDGKDFIDADTMDGAVAMEKYLLEFEEKYPAIMRAVSRNLPLED